MDNYKEEAVQLLSDLIQINTTNPPGNELAAVHCLQALAQQHGMEAESYETAPGRGNLVVKVPGTHPILPPLILLSHLDVVPADPSGWKLPPFSGVLQDGAIWGRGAVDTKQLTTMEMMALIRLKREGIVPNRDLYLIATADEEQGSRLGLRALLEDQGDLFADAEVISEGGGFPILVNGVTFYLCETGQKGPCIVRFRIPRQANANPFFPNLSGVQAGIELLLRLENFSWPGSIPATTQHLLMQLSRAAQIDATLSLQEKLNQLAEVVSPRLQKILSAMVKNTVTVTVWNGGRRWKSSEYDNELTADVRLLPGVTREELEARLDELTMNLPVEWEIESFQEGYESSADSPLFQALSAALEERLPGAHVVPFLSAGASDGRFLQSYGAKVYGFSPVLAEDMTFDQAVTMVHGVDERIAVDSLVFGAEVLYQSVKSRCQEKIYE